MKHALYDWWDANTVLFLAINGHSLHALDSVMGVASYVADIWSFPVYAVVWWLWLRWLQRNGAVWTAGGLQLRRFVIGFALAILSGAALKYGLDLPRPASVLGPDVVHVVGDFDPQHTLPSGHAMFAMLLVASLWPLLPAAGRAAAAAYALWVGVARVWIGAHFPADVAAGYLLAIACAALARMSLPSRAHAGSSFQSQCP